MPTLFIKHRVAGNGDPQRLTVTVVNFNFIIKGIRSTELGVDTLCSFLIRFWPYQKVTRLVAKYISNGIAGHFAKAAISILNFALRAGNEHGIIGFIGYHGQQAKFSTLCDFVCYVTGKFDDLNYLAIRGGDGVVRSVDPNFFADKPGFSLLPVRQKFYAVCR